MVSGKTASEVIPLLIDLIQLVQNQTFFFLAQIWRGALAVDDTSTQELAA